MKISLLYIALLPILINWGFAQSPCIPISKALVTLSSCNCISVSNNEQSILKNNLNISTLTNVTSVQITDLDSGIQYISFKTLPNLKSITINNSPNLNFSNVFKQLSGADSIKELILNNNNIKTIPVEIKLLKNLNHLVISGNDSINTESLKILKHLSQLKNLSIPLNQIDQLSSQIGKLKSLERLDISNNNLTELPSRMGDLNNLDSLFIEENIIENPAITFNDLKGLNIKFLSIDTGYSEEELTKLKDLFPSAKIVERYIKPALNNIEITSKVDSIEKNEEFEIGNILLASDTFCILSPAYLHYPEIFNNDRFKYRFDTLLFDERYMDTTYSNTWRIQPFREYMNFSLYIKKGVKGEIWFDFHPNNKNRYLLINNPELNAFSNMYWVYDGKLPLKEFKQKYIYLNRKKKKFWIDTRIYYNEDAKNFTIELKDRTGFTRLIAYPRYPDMNFSLEKSQESYIKRYTQYSKTLEKRRDKFHARLIREKQKYDSELIKSKNNAWNAFKTMHMSNIETKMSQKQWLDYYDKIVANEKKALGNSKPTLELIMRRLSIQGYQATNIMDLISNNNTRPINATFCDADSNNLPIQQVILIDSKEKKYYIYSGSLGLTVTTLYIPNQNNMTLISQLRNLNLGIQTSEKINTTPVNGNPNITIVLDIINNKLGTVNQILNLLDL